MNWFLIILLVAAVAVITWYFFFRKPSVSVGAPSTTGTPGRSSYLGNVVGTAATTVNENQGARVARLAVNPLIVS